MKIKSFIVIVATCSIMSYWDAFGCDGGIFMKEIIKDVIGFESGYSISSNGYIISKRTNSKLFSRKQNSGYLLAHLCNNGARKAVTIHRIVALHFIDNPLNKPFVNHKDGNKLNCAVDNLEWATGSENMRHAFDTGLMPPKSQANIERIRALGKKYGRGSKELMAKNIKERKPVIQLDMQGNFVKEWESMKSAKRAGFHNIAQVLRGEYKQSGGFKWVLVSSQKI